MSGASGRLTRRAFLASATSCGAWVATSLRSLPAAARERFAGRQLGEVVADEPFARLERLGDGVWAVVSKPLEGRETLSNGGIVAGRDGALAIEGFNTPEGARWLTAQAERLTGMRPEQVVLTHFHGDHSRGLPGYRWEDGGRATVWSTATTRGLLEGSDGSGEPEPVEMLSAEAMIDEDGDPLEIDLGGRVVRVAPRLGHTPSDLSIEVVDPRVVFCGDLVWNGMFPNYRDAIPSRLYRHCAELLSDPEAVYVPGHGSLADAEGIRPYLGLLADVGRAAQMAHDEGLDVVEAAESYAVPDSLGEWFRFSERYYEVAFRAWYRELDRDR